jgi:predicted metal-dependent enzyme (double-stranded beta helix superfamily)
MIFYPLRSIDRAVDPARLVEFTTMIAAEVRAGQYPFVDFSGSSEQQRWHQRIYRDPRIDIWLISWLPTQGTELHDHGGSSGAFTVLSGTLTESVPSGYADGRVRIRHSARAAGESVRFGRHYIHDVRNAGTAAAISVHAYSPPLTRMTYYDVQAGDLAAVRTLATDDPEPSVPVRLAS